jgi:ATP-dependent helicase Lhr and Lhr-like helicase
LNEYDLSGLPAPIASWFATRGWAPFDFQREVWAAYLGGESGLVHAATGTGKTLAAWIGPLIEAYREADGEDRRSPAALRVLWVTPLRALAADTARALSEVADATGLGWTVEKRTGDTPASIRSRQARRLPTALVTTPESLALLFTREDHRALLSDLRLVVVDEWHELMGTKRGVQVELELARLRSLRPDLRTWALSATLGNLDEALDRVLGPAPREPGRIVRGIEPKSIVVDALIPPNVERFPWAGHLGTQMLPQVIDAIEEGETAIVFTNTRSQTEIWYRAILAARPDWAGRIALHHGSLDRVRREWVENGLRTGSLRCVVATSSLDLGVDFSPVDRVLQVGSPKGVARLLQRAGRSGHQPGAVSRVTCVPTMILELIEVAAARDGVERGAIESRYGVSRPLDLLVQHLVTVALGGGFESTEMLSEVRRTRAFADLDEVEWRWALDFITRGGDALRAYPEFSKVTVREGRYVVDDAAIARRHRMSIGTIVDDAQITVQYLGGARLGSVEEQFISRLAPGDRFHFAGKPLEFVRVRDMKAWVRRAPSTKGAIPRWLGTRFPLSGALAAALRNRLEEAASGIFRGPEMEAVRPILDVQSRWSVIPAADELLIESVRTREGHHLFFFPFEGRLVHEGLAALFAYRIARLEPITFTMAANDWGFELLSPEPAPMAAAIDAGLLSADDLLDDITASLNATEMARRQFREVARVAGLIFTGYPGAGRSVRQLQASSGLFFDVFSRYDAANPLLSQAYREVLEKQLESSRIWRTLERLSRARIRFTAPERTPPLAFPLLVDRTRERVSSEALADRIRRMQLALERAAG